MALKVLFCSDFGLHLEGPILIFAAPPPAAFGIDRRAFSQPGFAT